MFKDLLRTILSVVLNFLGSKRHEWEPRFFGEKKHTKKLVEKVSRFQKSYGIRETGIVDKPTIRRRITEKEARSLAIMDNDADKKSYIICKGSNVLIEWDKVVTFQEPRGLSLGPKTFRRYKSDRKPTMFVVHWDVCLSSESCFKILEKRGLSVHFLIDNDGTIFQIMDCNDIGFHAGNRKVNNASIGVEISNAYYPKYQRIYEKRGFGKRPVLNGVKVHGEELEPFLGFYPVQLEALKALSSALSRAYGIPLVAPKEEGVSLEARTAKFNGVVNHYHLTKRKIDCAGLRLDKLFEE